MRYKYIVENYKRVYYLESGYTYPQNEVTRTGVETIFETSKLPSKNLEENDKIILKDKEYNISRIRYNPEEDECVIILSGGNSFDDLDSLKRSYDNCIDNLMASLKEDRQKQKVKYEELQNKFYDYRQIYTRKGWFK
jgi:sugar diacid utilization regulator